MEQKDLEENTIVKLSLEFALLAIEYCELLDNQKKFVISKQLLKSATSIGANVFESQNAESKNDFIHKLKISAKEAFETEYWLIICNKAANYPSSELLLEKLKSIQKILTKIIATSKRRNN